MGTKNDIPDNQCKHGLPALFDERSRILILGTMPGEQSIAKQQYYANAGNRFWKLLSLVFDEPFPASYDERRLLLRKHNIALWNVLAGCERKGSADHAIRNARPNDFNNLFASYPNIRIVAFESKGAADFYKKHVARDFGWEFITLPSTSGLHARMTFDEKLSEWRALRDL